MKTKWKRPSQVRTLWVGKALLYQAKNKEKIATLTMSELGYVILWHEFVPRLIHQRFSSLWSSLEAAQHIIYAAHAEALEAKARKEWGEVSTKKQH